MNKIEIGEYVRTNDGFIAKVIEIREHCIEFDNSIIYGYEGEESYLYDNYNIEYKDSEYNKIENHSKDIIDLITIEDIFKIKEGDTIVYIGFTNNYAEEYADFIERVKNKEIELLEVLTKEQFSENSYKVGK